MDQTVQDISCHHIRVNGTRCGSPRLTGKTFCFFHNKVNQTHSEPDRVLFRRHFFHENNITSRKQNPNNDYDNRDRRPNGPRAEELPPLEDSESIQLALSMVVAAVADARIETKRASVLLYALQIASQNVRRVKLPAEGCVQETATDYAGREIAASPHTESLGLEQSVQQSTAPDSNPQATDLAAPDQQTSAFTADSQQSVAEEDLNPEDSDWALRVASAADILAENAVRNLRRGLSVSTTGQTLSVPDTPHPLAEAA